MCFYKCRESSGCHLCLQFRPLPTSFRIPFLMPLVCLYLPGLITAASQIGGWIDLRVLVTTCGPTGPVGSWMPFLLGKAGWQIASCTALPGSYLAVLAAPNVHSAAASPLKSWSCLKMEKFKITIRCLLSNRKDLTSVIRCFFRSNFLKYPLDFYFRWSSQDYKIDYSQSQNPRMVRLGVILKPIQFQLLLKSEECRHPGICSEFVKVWKTGSCDGCDDLHLLKTYHLPKKGEEAIWCDVEK